MMNPALAQAIQLIMGGQKKPANLMGAPLPLGAPKQGTTIGGVGGPENQMMNQGNAMGVPSVTPSAPTQPGMPRENIMPDLSGLQGQRDQAMSEAFAPGPQQESPISKKDLPFLILGLLGAKALGVKNRDISEFGQGFLGARQQEAAQKFKNAESQDRTKKQQAMAKYGQIGEEIDYQRSKADRLMAGEDARTWENEKDVRNFDQQKAILDQQQKFSAEEKAKDREARKSSQAGQALNKQSSMERTTITNLNGTPEEKAEGLALIEQRDAYFYGDAPPLTYEQSERLRGLLAKGTVANALKEGELKWQDKQLELDYNTGIERLKQMGIVTKIRAKDLKNYDENQRLKRVMWYALFNQRQQNIDFGQAMDIYDAQNDRALNGIKGLKAYQEDLKKRKKTWWEQEKKNKAGAAFGINVLPDEPPTDTKFDNEINRIQGAIDKLNRALPDVPTVPTGGNVAGVVQPPPTGMVDLPPIPDPGNFDKSGGAAALTKEEEAANKKAKGMAPLNGGELPIVENKPKGQLITSGPMKGGYRLPGGGVWFPPTNNPDKKENTKKPEVKKDTRTPAQKAKDKLKQSGKWDT